MRDDLLDAQAAIDWTRSKIEAFGKEIDGWLQQNTGIEIRKVPDPATHNPVVLIEKSPLPRAANVEVGAYINVIRSSLDILATSLAHRYGVPKPDKVSFPVVESEKQFRSSDYKGASFIQALPAAQRAIIEALKPYQGGDERLWALHQLDIMRKHRRLIDVVANPMAVAVLGPTIGSDYVQVATGFIRVGDGAVFGLLRKGAPKPDIRIAPYIAFNENGPMDRQPVISALLILARYVEKVIALFDEA